MAGLRALSNLRTGEVGEQKVHGVIDEKRDGCSSRSMGHDGRRAPRPPFIQESKVVVYFKNMMGSLKSELPKPDTGLEGADPEGRGRRMIGA